MDKKIAQYLTLEHFLYFFIISITFLFFIKTGGIYYPDSEGYLNMSLYRSCGYPLFIAFFKFIFGQNYIAFLLLSQFLFCISACLYLTRSIKRTIQLNKWYLVIVFGFLIVPILYEIKVSNSILSESLAYPLYLIIIGNLLLAFVNNQFKNFYFALIFTYFLILIRGQFLFITPVIIIGILLMNFKEIFQKKYILLILLAVLIPILTITTDIIFHKIAHNKTTTTPWTGIQIATMPFFVADENDFVIFDDKMEQDYFKFVFKRIQEKKLLLSQLDAEEDQMAFYSNNYTKICNSTINDDGEKFFNPKLNDDLKTIENNKITTSITLPLIKDNFKKWTGIYIRNVINGVGSSKMLLLYIILFVLNLYTLIKKENKASKFILVCLLLLFGNDFLVALAEPTTSRYIFYNNWILVTIVLFLYQNTFLKKSNE